MQKTQQALRFKLNTHLYGWITFLAISFFSPAMEYPTKRNCRTTGIAGIKCWCRISRPAWAKQEPCEGPFGGVQLSVVFSGEFPRRVRIRNLKHAHSESVWEILRAVRGMSAVPGPANKADQTGVRSKWLTLKHPTGDKRPLPVSLNGKRWL